MAIPGQFPAIPAGKELRPTSQRLRLQIDGTLQQRILFLIGAGQVQEQQEVDRAVRRRQAQRFFEYLSRFGQAAHADQAGAQVDAVAGCKRAVALPFFQLRQLFFVGRAQRIRVGGDLRRIVDRPQFAQMHQNAPNRIKGVDLRVVAGILARRIEIVDAGRERAALHPSAHQQGRTQHDSTHSITSAAEYER